MMWVYFVLFFVHATVALKLTDYYKEPLFNDNLCMSAAVQLTGVFPGWLSCGTACVKRKGCKSFFFNSVSLECFSVNAVLTSREGCETRFGTSYFLRQSEDDCYLFSPADYDQMSLGLVSPKDLCESYSFHVYTAGNNQEFKHCGGCYCCQVKGCYNGGSREYSGTWSQTKFGRSCQRWDSQSPHSHTWNTTSEFPLDASVYDARNYCRDPNHYGSVWCYTEDPSVQWEICNIPTC